MNIWISWNRVLRFKFFTIICQQKRKKLRVSNSWLEASATESVHLCQHCARRDHCDSLCRKLRSSDEKKTAWENIRLKNSWYSEENCQASDGACDRRRRVFKIAILSNKFQLLANRFGKFRIYCFSIVKNIKLCSVINIFKASITLAVFKRSKKQHRFDYFSCTCILVISGK